MVLEFNTTMSDGTTVTLPLNGLVDVTVDWGDGTFVPYAAGAASDVAINTGSPPAVTVRSGNVITYEELS